MDVFLDTCISTLTQGLIYALLSCGIYITYKILDFPDLTVDGSFPLGAAVTAVLLTRGVNPWLISSQLPSTTRPSLRRRRVL